MDEIEMRDPSRSHLMHPWAVVVLAYWVLLGLSLVVSIWVPDWVPIVAIARVDEWLAGLIGGFMAVGAGLTLVSDRRWRWRSTRYTLERAGLVLLMGAWLAFILVSAPRFPGAVSGWLQGVAALAACWLRLREVSQAERQTQENVQRMESGDA